jgi:hypothetical protein
MTASAILLVCGLAAVGQTPTASARGDTGLRVGKKSKVHVSLGTSFIFDTNPNRFSNAQSDDNTDFNTSRLNFRPGLELDIPGQVLKLQATASGNISIFFENPDADPSVADPGTEALFGFDSGIDMLLGRKTSPVQLRVKNDLQRSPTVLDAAGTLPADEVAFRAWTNRARVGLLTKPGGGALEFEMAYINELAFFDNIDSAQEHGGLLEARYRFLPESLVYVRGDLSVFNPELETPNVESTLPATPINITVGLSTLLTPKLDAEVAVGYGNALVAEDDFFGSLAPSNRETVIALARLGYSFAPTVRVSAGYRRVVEPTVLLQSVVRNIADANVNVGIEKFLFDGSFSYDARNFGVDDRSAGVVVAGVGVTYYVFPWLAPSLRYRVINQTSNDPSDVDPVDAEIFLGEFTRQQIIAAVNLRY